MDESGNADGIPGITVPRLCGRNSPVFPALMERKRYVYKKRPCAGIRHRGVSSSGVWRRSIVAEAGKAFRHPLSSFAFPGDDEHRKAPASPGCYIDQNKARLGGAGGSLRGEGEPFVRQPKGSPSPLNQKKTKKLSTKSLTSGGLRRSVRLRRLRRTANDAKASRN